MYAGHVGIALGLRRARSAPALWLLVIASQLPDWGDALLDLYGDRPADAAWGPHGWPLVGVGALGVAIVGARLTRTWRGGILAALACVSHWCADFLTGWKPTWPGGPDNVGLGWYAHAPRDFVLESAVTLVGWLLWRGSLPRTTSEESASYSWRGALEWALLVALVLMQLAVDAVMAKHGVGQP
ncbi:MAG TPA: hypothetical protein VGD56_02490 [Gemmatirosa sp.]